MSGSDLTYTLFEREIGYWLTGGGEGRGTMSEAVRAMTRLAFELYGLDRPDVHTDRANTRSRASPERLGLTHELPLKRRVLNSDGQLADSVIYTRYRLGLGAPEARHQRRDRAPDARSRCHQSGAGSGSACVGTFVANTPSTTIA